MKQRLKDSLKQNLRGIYLWQGYVKFVVKSHRWDTT
jgi:hypothetical protein